MRKLNCLIISTGRAASTAVYRYLDERADLNLPINKEPHHWCDITAYSGRYPLLNAIYVPDSTQYEDLYRDSARMIDASVGYFFAIDEVISRLGAAKQRPRVLFLYREPISRAASLFHELRKKGLEEARTLADALRETPDAGLWWEHYYDNVAYDCVYRALTAYFPHIMAISYDAFAARPGQAMDRIMDFLDLKSVRDIRYDPVNSSAEAILRRQVSCVQGLARHVPAGWRRRLVSGYSGLRHVWSREAAPAESYFPLSVAEYKAFRELIDERDIIYAPGN